MVNSRIGPSRLHLVVMFVIVLIISIFFGTTECQSLWGISNLGRLDIGPLLSIQMDPNQLGINRTRCLGVLGCFFNGPPYRDMIRRPISLLPYEREALDVRFMLFTRNNIDQPQEIWSEKAETLIKSNFNAEHDTKVIVHGLLDAVVYGKWLEEMRREYLKIDDYNIIVVDWARANRMPYEQAVANSRAVGAEVALLIETLIAHRGANSSRFHIIGHSLGAQIAGYAGARIRNLGRITGLDPAGPYFTGTEKEVRLDSTDANFVDAIHSDASTNVLTGLGTVDTVGHLDFYPNGANHQPGCQAMNSVLTILSQGFSEGLRRLTACDHQRAVDFFISTINNPQCDMVGIACPDYDSFKSGHCGDCDLNGSRCSIMGNDAEQYFKLSTNLKSRKYYLMTTGDKPFCLHQYHVTLMMEDSPKITSAAGEAFLSIDGSRVHLKARLSDGIETFRPGSVYQYIIASKIGIGEFDNADFHWEEDSFGTTESRRARKLFNGPPRLSIKYLKISQLGVPGRKGKILQTHVMCTENGEPAYADQPVRLAAYSRCKPK